MTHDPFSQDAETRALIRDGDGFKLRSHKIRMDVVAGPDAPQTVVLSGPEARVGSGKQCDLTLRDSTVSRHHVTFRVERQRIRVVDAGSRNGTNLDGVDIVDAYARPDSAITIGESVLKLKLISDVVDLPISDKHRFGALIGRSIPMRQLFAVLERVAQTDATVLVEGESGTGKELIAEAVHDSSPRSERPFIVFDCSAITPTLMDSELFGHVKGAFTGAFNDRVGAFEAADGGTLFLDEVGELPLDLQPKLLRAIERLEVCPVGTHERRRVDVRIIAATNRNLAHEVERKAFREDLYYRLAVVRVTAPPLRERTGDVAVLVQHFVDQLGGRYGYSGALPEETVRTFQTMAWPGNVRELRNAVARALAVGPPREARSADENAAIDAQHSMPQVDLSVPLKVAKAHVTETFERAYLEEALRIAGGNMTRAAEIAQVHRKYIQRALRRYELSDE